jgi:uncharacterized membrane protein YphA (DoxX/SURF4 family)
MLDHRRTAVLVVASLLALLVLLPPPIRAHERWFTPDGPYWDPDLSRLWSLPMLLAVLSAAAAVGALYLGQRWTKDPLWPRPPIFQRLEPAAPAILGVQTAITMIFAATRLNLFVPNIELPENALGVAIAGIAIVAAFSFITGVFARSGALITAGLFLLCFVFGTWYEALEQVLFVGIAVYLLAVGRGVVRYGTEHEEDRAPLFDALLPHALTILRVCAGVSILVLGLSEKLLAPGLGEAFLQEYPRFNFMQELGFDWWTDRRFVYAAGIVEFTAGVALLSGFLTRVTILALWIPFNVGIAFLPPEELIGHLPILATMYVLLVRGTEGIPPPTAATTGEDVAGKTGLPNDDQRPASAIGSTVRQSRVLSGADARERERQVR